MVSHKFSSRQEEKDALGDGWFVDSKGLAPTYGELEKMCKFLSNRAKVDPCITFSFSNQGSSAFPSLEINSSRLEYVAGPLSTMISSTFSEGLTGQVNLCEADRPPVCTLLRDFLYTRPVCLQDVSFKDICNLAKAAHRWDLSVLFNGILLYVKDRGLLSSPTQVILFAEVIELQISPLDHTKYFWKQVGKLYKELAYPCKVPHLRDHAQNPSRSDVKAIDSCSDSHSHSSGDKCSRRYAKGEHESDESLSGTEDSQSDESLSGTEDSQMVEDDEESLVERSSGEECPNSNGNDDHMLFDREFPTADRFPNKEMICPGLPRVWSTALSQNMVRVILSRALRYSSSRKTKLHLWHVVLMYLEPRIASDGEFCSLLEIMWEHCDQRSDSVLDDVSIDEQCRTRAMRLFAKTQREALYE
ncbi:unnamed protein product [Chondrus crispus]|uniref:BTB domain-containing protein n=1 Tax=Chondrus crispus TaxID=2769 RepID=R7Q353_CHOCR|nr:unnamed protein product [Chondrus crispus]CDF32333.1 unnamed protein product [Chondrus crispus]|eukprot:XP_005711998.1 unnamed protein product [Chondrus crispus]